MAAAAPVHVAQALGLRPGSLITLRDVPSGNGNWLAETLSGRLVVLRRYHTGATPEDLSYEHAVLRYLASAGWVVPEPVSDLIREHGLWYCLTRYVPGAAVRSETTAQRRRRGADLARLHLTLRGFGGRAGQRTGWRAQHHGTSVHTGIDWDACLSSLSDASPRLGAWAAAAAVNARDALAAVGAAALPLTVVHGDFAEWNVHYERGELAGVIDFGLTHLDSRPYELAIARTYRAPEVVDGYCAGLTEGGWPFSGLEEAAITPVYQAFRVDMTAWLMDHGRRAGEHDLAAIGRQLSRTGTSQPAMTAPSRQSVSLS